MKTSHFIDKRYAVVTHEFENNWLEAYDMNEHVHYSEAPTKKGEPGAP